MWNTFKEIPIFKNYIRKITVHKKNVIKINFHIPKYKYCLNSIFYIYYIFLTYPKLKIDYKLYTYLKNTLSNFLIN